MLMRMALYVGVGVAIVALAVIAIGYALPQGHVASVEARLASPPAVVFARIANPAAYPQWRADIARVDVLSASPLTWREHGSDDPITFAVVESVPPERFVVRIADADLPFGGTWTYELKADGSGTRLVITERGEVYNPVFRFMSRFVFSRTATMERFVASLKSAT